LTCKAQLRTRLLSVREGKRLIEVVWKEIASQGRSDTLFDISSQKRAKIDHFCAISCYFSANSR
jgi:hypothetical protein